MRRRVGRTPDRGAAAVEMALVLPLLLFVIFGLIEFGRMLNTQLTLTEAARAGALAGQRAVKVLVVHKLIPAGTTGKEIVDGGYTETVTVPASTVPADALSTVDGDLLTLAVTSDLQPRQLLLRGAFDSLTVHSGGLSVPDGMLAVSVAMRVPAQVAGYVQPGSDVAVFDTFNEADSKGRVPAGDGLAASHDYVQATRLLLPKVL